MAFSRASALPSRPSSDQLGRDLSGIGMKLAVEPNPGAQIEDTLVHASEVGTEDQDLRVLSLLTTWLGVHHARINADRLVRAVQAHPSARVRAYWSATALRLAKDRRFARLGAVHTGPALDLLPVGTDFQLARRGVDQRFVGSALRVPAGVLRDRPGDVASPEVLVRHHPGYRNRVLLGPTWRADVWTVLEDDPTLTVAEAARRAGCSFATAWEVARDFALLRAA